MILNEIVGDGIRQSQLPVDTGLRLDASRQLFVDGRQVQRIQTTFIQFGLGTADIADELSHGDGELFARFRRTCSRAKTSRIPAASFTRDGIERWVQLQVVFNFSGRSIVVLLYGVVRSDCIRRTI